MTRGLRKGIAIWQLLWAVADISIPRLCASETVLIPDAQLVLTSTPPSASHDSPGSRFISDDCFCCCSHIVPSPHFVLAIVPQIVPAEVIVARVVIRTCRSVLFHAGESVRLLRRGSHSRRGRCSVNSRRDKVTPTLWRIEALAD